MDNYVEVAERAARAGGQVLIDMCGSFTVREKGPKDLVTEADTSSQRIIREILLDAFPDHAFVGEEDIPATRTNEPQPNGFRWIVDPLDGTTNYVHGLPGYATSIALAHGDEIVAGVIFDPVVNECYSAEKGAGAFLNSQPLRVSDCRELTKALAAASFSANIHRNSVEVVRFVEVLIECQSLRRLGSAALNLCYLAAGRLDAYWATSVKQWDVAAGLLLVEEAGGIITALDGSKFFLSRPEFIAASTAELHQQLLQTIAKADAHASETAAPAKPSGATQ